MSAPRFSPEDAEREATAAAGLPSASASVYTGILKGSAIYSIAAIAPKVASILLLRVYTRYLTPSDYGVMELLELSVSVIGLLACSNVAAGFLFFYFKTEDRDLRRTTASSALLGAALFGVALALVGLTVAPAVSQLVFGTPQYATFFRIASATLGLSLPMEIGYAYLRAENRAWAFVGFSLAGLVISACASVLLLAVGGWGVRGVLVGTLIMTSTLAACLAGWMLSRVGVAFRPLLFYKLFRYSIPTTLSGGSLFLLHFSDRFVLQRNISLADLGRYSLAYKFGMLVAFVQSPFNNYWTSQMYVLLKDEGGPSCYRKVFTHVVTGLTYVTVLLAAASGPALRILTTQDFWPAAPYVPWLAAAYVIRAAGDQFRSIYYFRGRPAMDAAVMWASGLLCLATSLALIPTLKVWGAVVATIAGFLAVAVIGFFTSRRMMTFRIDWRRVIAVLAAGAVFCASLRLTSGAHLAFQMAGAAGAAFLFPLSLWVLGFFTENEKRFIVRAVRDAIGRVRSG